MFSQGLETESGIAADFSLPDISFCRILLCKPNTLLKPDPNGCVGCSTSQAAINYSIVLLHIRKTAHHKFSAAFHSKPHFSPCVIYLIRIPLKVVVSPPQHTTGQIQLPEPNFPTKSQFCKLFSKVCLSISCFNKVNTCTSAPPPFPSYFCFE